MALTGGIVVWVGLHGDHLLWSILRGHIHRASACSWGTADLAWIVSPGGHLILGGSETWQNICRHWEGLQRMVKQLSPTNIDEWRALPLWWPHVNYRDGRRARCKTAALRRLRDASISRMGDVSDAIGDFLPWEGLRVVLDRNRSRESFQALISNLNPVPNFDHSLMHPGFFVEGYVTDLHQTLAWQFELQASWFTAQWIPFLDRNSATCTSRPWVAFCTLPSIVCLGRFWTFNALWFATLDPRVRCNIVAYGTTKTPYFHSMDGVMGPASWTR